MPLTVTDCVVTTNSIELTFSDPVVPKHTTATVWVLTKDGLTDEQFKHSALNPANYSIFDPGSADFKTPTKLTDLANHSIVTPNPTLPYAKVSAHKNTVTFTFTMASSTATEFQAGDWIHIAMHNIHGLAEAGDARPGLEGNFATEVQQVPGDPETERVTRTVEDAISYPILTEQINPGSIMSRPGGGSGGYSSGGGTQGLGQIASQAISDALGWKPTTNDPKGFVGALTQSFTLTEVEGHVESKWNPRTYTVQTDLAGGITGAQASLYTRARDAQDNCLRLLDGLYPLDPTADTEFVKALREMAKSQIIEIVKQFSVVPPSILRVNTYFKILLGLHHLRFDEPYVQSDPDKVKGTLGSIRDTYGIYFQNKKGDNKFSNSIEDEANITNFRVISDYMTSLLLSWLSNGRYFRLSTTGTPAFMGTQLVLISRQLNVIAETVNEVRFALDSVFIGPNERQTLLLDFKDSHDLPAMYLEDVLTEIEGSVSEEMPRLIRDGGRIAINNNLLPVLQTLRNMVEAAKTPKNLNALPDGYRTARVRRSLEDLSDQLNQLFEQGQQIGMEIPGALEIEVGAVQRSEARDRRDINKLKEEVKPQST